MCVHLERTHLFFMAASHRKPFKYGKIWYCVCICERVSGERERDRESCTSHPGDLTQCQHTAETHNYKSCLVKKVMSSRNDECDLCMMRTYEVPAFKRKAYLIDLCILRSFSVKSDIEVQAMYVLMHHLKVSSNAVCV